MTENLEKTILLLPGDGIGEEITQQAVRIIDWINGKKLDRIMVTHGLIGGASYEAHGMPLSDDTLAAARKASAILMGSVGGPQWDNVDYAKRPEAGLLKLRKELDLFANLRPAIVFDALVDASTLKPEIVRGLDILIVRELTGGVYFGEPRGVEDIGGGERRGINTHVYTTSEVLRAARVAFDLARKRDGRVCSCDKANVMEAGKMWREDVTALHEKEFSDVELTHMYADNCAMQLLRAPAQFDVIFTDNLFGDMLSDEAAMLTGSLGMLPSASLGAQNPETGMPFALYEPVHGSAPDIAGQNIANPLATILSLAMLLRYSFDRGDLADLVENAVKNTLEKGVRTADITDTNHPDAVSTAGMGDAVLRELEILSGEAKASLAS